MKGEDMAKDLSSFLPSTEDIIRALGVRRQTQGADVLPGLALFGAGILVGAGLALLFAPSTGEDLREEIGQRFDELRQRFMSEQSTSPTGNGSETHA